MTDEESRFWLAIYAIEYRLRRLERNEYVLEARKNAAACADVCLKEYRETIRGLAKS